MAAFSVDCPYSLDDLKQPRSAGDSVGFQRRGNGKADRLFCPALIGNDKIGDKVRKIAHILIEYMGLLCRCALVQAVWFISSRKQR